MPSWWLAVFNDVIKGKANFNLIHRVSLLFKLQSLKVLRISTIKNSISENLKTFRLFHSPWWIDRHHQISQSTEKRADEQLQRRKIEKFSQQISFFFFNFYLLTYTEGRLGFCAMILKINWESFYWPSSMGGRVLHSKKRKIQSDEHFQTPT